MYLFSGTHKEIEAQCRDIDPSKCLTQVEYDRISRYSSETKKNESLLARKALYLLLIRNEILDDGQPLELCYTAYGKPSLASDNPPLHINWSHSKDWIAVCADKHVNGIDVEEHRNVSPLLVKRICSKDEQQILDSLSGVEWNSEFFKLWVLKECVVKTLGKGISYGVDKLTFAKIGDSYYSTIDQEGKEWYCYHKQLNDTSHLACCSEVMESVEELKK